MRSNHALALGFVFAAGCATSNANKVCTPAASWEAPATHCVARTVVAPKPEPVAAPEPPPPPPPPKAEVKGERIELKEMIEFRTGSAEIVHTSDGILDEVVKIMEEHTELSKIRIEGHTDSEGRRESNRKLSDERAASVRTYLEKHGIDASRLISKGFGQDKPIADNKTAEGRAQNRRVEIHIVERK
ncbi:MAG TPA: OmpA family protein [Polyangia bacterium]|jgi:outer membrane protein OmpA-like peptidoglycan-associated protein